MSTILQTLGQRSVRAEQAAIIYSLDPFYGALFARALLGEEFGMWGWVGSALILSAVLLSRAEVAIKAQSSASGSTGDNTEFD
jgi:drug/metabolite transporter (DMT)-like permease